MVLTLPPKEPAIPSPHTEQMVKFYQWSLGIVATLLVAFLSFYANTTERRIQDESHRNTQQEERLLDHEQRVTTLEESKRNQEQLLIEIKDSIRRVEDAIRRSK